MEKLSDDSFSNAYSETSSEEIPNLNNKILSSKIDETTVEETIINKLDNGLKTDNETIIKNISTYSEVENYENDLSSNIIEENEEDKTAATISELKEIKEANLLSSNLFGSGNHPSTANPRVVINSTYDRYEIYTGENAGTVRIYDDNGTYYNSNTEVKVIRDMIDTHNNSPILLKLTTNVQFFNFDNENDNYVLLPSGYVEDLVARESGNGYLNPQGINALDHISVNLTFNSTDLGTYDLFEYGVLYY